VLTHLARRTGVDAAEQEADRLAVRLAGEPGLAGGYADALDRFLGLGGDDFESASSASSTGWRRPHGHARGRARGRDRPRARLRRDDKPWSPWQLRLELAPAPPAGLVVELRAAVVERGGFRLGPVDLEL
jgi:hypothetical protein